MNKYFFTPFLVAYRLRIQLELDNFSLLLVLQYLFPDKLSYKEHSNLPLSVYSCTRLLP